MTLYELKMYMSFNVFRVSQHLKCVQTSIAIFTVQETLLSQSFIIIQNIFYWMFIFVNEKEIFGKPEKVAIGFIQFKSNKWNP